MLLFSNCFATNYSRPCLKYGDHREVVKAQQMGSVIGKEYISQLAWYYY